MRFPTRGPTKRKRNWPASSASACCACAPELQHKTISSAKQAFPLRSSATRTSIRKEYGNKWCRRRESNPRPRDYETLALPLSYAGTKTIPHATESVANVSSIPANVQRFRIEPGRKVRIGRLVKVLRIFGQAPEGTANSHGFFEGGIELATPFEGSTSRKIAMKIPGASRSIGRGERKTSGRHAGGGHLTGEVGRREPGPGQFCLCPAPRWPSHGAQGDTEKDGSQERRE